MECIISCRERFHRSFPPHSARSARRPPDPSLLPKGERRRFFILIRGLLKAPGLRIHPDGEGCAVFPVIAVHQVAHAVMAAGEGLFLQSPYGTSLLSIISHRIPFCICLAGAALPALPHYITVQQPLQTVLSPDRRRGTRSASSPALSRISWSRSKLLSSKIRLLFQVSWS